MAFYIDWYALFNQNNCAAFLIRHRLLLEVTPTELQSDSPWSSRCSRLCWTLAHTTVWRRLRRRPAAAPRAEPWQALHTSSARDRTPCTSASSSLTKQTGGAKGSLINLSQRLFNFRSQCILVIYSQVSDLCSRKWYEWLFASFVLFVCTKVKINTCKWSKKK